MGLSAAPPPPGSAPALANGRAHTSSGRFTRTRSPDAPPSADDTSPGATNADRRADGAGPAAPRLPAGATHVPLFPPPYSAPRARRRSISFVWAFPPQRSSHRFPDLGRSVGRSWEIHVSGGLSRKMHVLGAGARLRFGERETTQAIRQQHTSPLRAGCDFVKISVGRRDPDRPCLNLRPGFHTSLCQVTHLT